MSWLSRARDIAARGLMGGPKRLAANPDELYEGYWTSSLSGMIGRTDAGVTVTHDVAMRNSVVNACVRMWSYPTASCPIMVFKRLPKGGKRRAPEHPMYRLLHEKPNEYQTPWEFKQEVIGGLAMRGQSVSEKILSPRSRGGIEQLWPIHPDHYFIDWYNRRTGRRRVYDVSSAHDGKARVLLNDEVWHPRLMSLDGGLNGASPISLAAQGIGVATQSQRQIARLLRNDSRPPGVLKTEQTFKTHAEADAILDRWKQQQGGDNYGAPAVLGAGVDYKPITITPRDAQLIETMQWGAYDLARVWGMPLWMIQLEQKATAWGTGMAEMRLGAHTYVYFPIFTLLEEGLQRAVVDDEDDAFCEFVVDALLRADPKTRAAYYEAGINANNPWLTRNDIRNSENMEPDDGPDGDRFMPAQNNVGAPGAVGAPGKNGTTGKGKQPSAYEGAFPESEHSHA